MNHPPERYLENVLEQPEVLRSLIANYENSNWVAAFEAIWKPLKHLPILLTGMGASDSALWPLWYHLNRHGITAQKVETSELIHYLPNLLAQPGLCLAISQSGESVEIQRLVEKIHHNRKQGLKSPALISITTTASNSLSDGSDLKLHTEAGAEVGVATKTFTSTLAVLHLIGRLITENLQTDTFSELRQTANAQAEILNQWQDWLAPACRVWNSVQSYALVGRGPSQAAVNDGALVLKESLRRMAHGFSGGEFRHGPMEMLNNSLGVMVFNTPGSTLELSLRLSHDVVKRGGALITVGPQRSSPNHLVLPPVAEDLMPILEILPIQLLAHHFAQTIGLIPGNFQWSGKVVLQE